MSENHEIHLTEYKCKECNKFYASQSSLCNHNKKFHNNTNTVLPQNSTNSPQNPTITPHHIIQVVPDNKLTCLYCNKILSRYDSLKRHQTICNVKLETDKINEIKLKELDIAKMKEENKNLELQIKLKNNNDIVPFGQNNINNGITNNNTVTINKIGTEPIVFKTKDIKSIANDGMNGPITCVRQLNFDKNKPQNHSYCVTSLEGEYCTAINHETQQPEKVPKKEVIDQVFESAYRFIESVAAQIKEDSTLRDKLTNKEIKEINRIVDNKSKFYEKNNRKTFYNSINSMSYNYKELVLTTWKLLKPLEENLLDDNESDSEYDYTIKEVTEFPDINDDDNDDSDNEVYVVNTNNNQDSDSDDDFNLLTALK